MRLKCFEEDCDVETFDTFGMTENGHCSVNYKTTLSLSSAKGQGDMTDSKNDDTVKDESQNTEKIKCLDIIYVASDECEDSPVIPNHTEDISDESTDRKEQETAHTEERVKTKKKVSRYKENKSQGQSIGYRKEEYCNTDILVAAVFMLLKGGSMKIKPSKKGFLYVLLIFSGTFSTAASPIPPKSGIGGIKKYSLLNTSQCSVFGLTTFQTCEKDDSKFDIFVKFCGYADQCGHGFEPVCAYDDEGQMLHFCSPTGLTCHRQVRRRVARVDVDAHTVYVHEENCPPGRYRPRTSNCYDPCINRDQDVNWSQNAFFDPDVMFPDMKMSESNEVIGTEMETDQDSELNQTTEKPSGIQRQNLEADELSVGKDWHVNIVVVVTSAALLLAMIGIVFLLKHNPDMSKLSLVEQI